MSASSEAGITKEASSKAELGGDNSVHGTIVAGRSKRRKMTRGNVVVDNASGLLGRLQGYQ
jgi:hypothetical protein